MKQHRTLRQGLGILLALTMGLCLLASTALAEWRTADFITSPTEALIMLTNGVPSMAEWQDNNLLILKGVNFSTSAEIAVLLPAGSTIQLEEGTTNTIQSTNSDQTKENSCGIYCGGNLTIGGPGGTLNVTGGAAKSGSDGISVTGGNLTILGGTVGATGGNANSSTGIYSGGLVTIEGDAVTAKGSDGTKSSYGIYARSVEISDGTVNATGGNGADEQSVGIWSHAAVTISNNANVTATGGTAKGVSCGIWATELYEGDVTITGGTVIATGNTADCSSGIRAGWTRNITIEGGRVTAKTLATTATNKSALFVAGGGALALSGYANYQWRISSGGDFTVSTTTPYTYSAAHTYVEFSPGPITCIVRFNANGGWDSMSDVTVVSGSYTLPDCGFTAPGGMKFKAWSVNNTEYAVGNTITISADTVVFAVWEVDPDAGCYQTADFVYAPDDALALLNAAKTGTADSTWDSSTKTLTLNGVSFTTSADTAVQLPGGSTIVLAEGTKNTITSINADVYSYSYGIYVHGGDLTIKGSGELAVTGGGMVYSHGIGVYSGSLAITSGTVSFTGSTTSNASYGVFADYGVEISGGIVKATGGDVNSKTSSSMGICTARSVTITDGVVTARGGTSGYNSYGIQTGNNSAYTVTGGDVTAIGGNASERSYGIAPGTKPTISGGHVTAQTLGNAKIQSALCNAPNLSGYAGYQWRIAEGDEYTSSATVEYPYSESHTYVEFSQGPIVTTYAITATDGKATAAGAEISNAAEGTTVTLTANPAPAGKVFDKWVVNSGSITLADANSTTTTFTMPASAVSVKATYKTVLTTLSATVDTPVVGAMPDLTATVDGVGYRAENLSWYVYDGTDWNDASDQPFVAGMEYDIVLEFYADDGYAFAPKDTLSVTINGMQASYNSNAGDDAVRYQLWGIYPSSGDVHTHSFGSEWKSDANSHWHECACGERSEETAHTASDWIIDTAATAATDGTKHKECTVCRYVLETDTIPATGNPDDLPRTGDDSSLLLWLALLLASGLGVTGAVVYGRRNKYAK